MGRTLKRVPLDFDWPLNTDWRGYVNPYRSQKCEACDGSGQNPATKQIGDDFYDLANTGRRWHDRITQDEVDALVAEDRLRKWDATTRDWKSVPRTAEEVNAANGPHGSMLGDLSHDAINRWILVETRAKRLGVYGHCKTCEGGGEIWATPEIKAAAEAWKNFDPPTGEGFQLWQTTSEGAPVSPVFATIEALCEWAAVNATTFGSSKASAAEWRSMLDEGFVRHTERNMVFM